MRNKLYIVYFVVILLPKLIFAEDYYWVGGTGNWSDLNHWRTIDNQIPNEVPDANDNVIFNENSFIGEFDTVFIQTSNPTCKNMTWVNIVDTAFLWGGANAVSFDIFGSVILHPKLRNKYFGKITFLSNEPGNTIACAGANFPGDLFFEGNGEWILQDTLIILDTSDWRYVFYDLNTSSGNSFLIQHLNGRLDVNEKAIIGGTFVTGGNNPCELDLENSHVYLLNSWTLNGANLDFNGTNSYIYVGNAMSNFYGDDIYYNDVDIEENTGSVSNTGIHTFYRKIHFLNGGSLQGYGSGNMAGKFTIDTLFMSGSYKFFNSSPIARITGIGHEIHYTLIDTLITQIDVNNGTFHRIDILGKYNGNLFEGIPDEIKGMDNTFDTLMIYNTPCKFSGQNIITGLLYFAKESAITSIGENKNIINHAVFASNGYFEGNNDFGKLTLGAGYHYQLQSDSLVHPGSYHTNQFVQTIGQLEVSGNCNLGVTMLTSDYRPIQAIINYTGGQLTTDYLQVRDIKNIGTTMTVVNGIDAGNNEGILFTDPIQSRTLYWVNGQGEWSDINQWSLTSGGIGGECPPTRLDDVLFDNGSGLNFTEDTVLVRSPHIHCNDMTWVDGFSDIVHFASADTAFEWNYNDIIHVWELDTLILRIDSCALHICGSIELDPMLSYGFGGDVYFESENDDDYEIINVEWVGNRFNLRNKAVFDGPGGKWKLAEGTKFYNSEDSVIFRQGEWLLNNDTVRILNFISIDTLPRKISLLGKTLFVVRQWGADAWNVNASPGINGNNLFEFDAGNSTIRAMGDQKIQSTYIGQCNILTSGSQLVYHNIEFGNEYTTGGAYSALKSEVNCIYNCVDFYFRGCHASGSGAIDTLTWYPTSYNSLLNGSYDVNFVMAYGENNALFGNQNIDTALFYKEAIISGNHNIGYLRTDKSLMLDFLNVIDTAMMLGDTEIFGNNTFSQLILGSNSRFIFENNETTGNDTTVITDDFIVEGFCDGPIRLQSDIPGYRANILYKAQNPTNLDFTANYVSIQDIAMIPWLNNQYIATNSVDLENNENWIFDESGSETFYWIGGTGNWGDWQHWSYTSGGSPIAEQCTPREINSVVFDNNSFIFYSDTIKVNISNAYCKNMWWTFDPALANPTFSGDDSTSLHVYGSMMLNNNLLYNYSGKIFFDQYNEPGNLPDTIYSRGNTFLNDVYFQGKDDVIILDDNMSLSAIDKCILHHLYGDFLLNGHSLNTGSFQSKDTSNRIIDMEYSTVRVNYSAGRAFWLEGQNLELHAGHSTIINESSGGSVAILNGDSFTFNDIFVNGGGDSLFNQNNDVYYRLVDIDGDASLITGNFTADSVLLRGKNSAIFKNGNINVVVVDGENGSVNDFQQINRCFFNDKGKVKGNNIINYCLFLDDGTFLGQNIFDTLVLYPGQGNAGNQGNWFYFQIDSIQVINDSLYIRGNQCSNINISTTPLNSSVPAYIRKDYGFNVAADYLNIYNVGAISSGDVEFYAGTNSTPLPDPSNPPPGWIFENAQGYISGFNGRTEHFCTGDTLILDAGDFNGDPTTQYLWEGLPGGVLLPVTEPGFYNITVIYDEGCQVNDYIVVEENTPPEALIPEGPFCEGYPIEIEVTPQHDDYTFEWWNGETTSSIMAQIQYTGTIFVIVTDTITTCIANPVQDIVVRPTPNPDDALGADVTIDFGETITLDAGEGDYYDWISEPYYPINNSDQRYITVSGYTEPVEYIAYVEIDGCGAEGTKVVSMYPPSRLGIPTAFSPNGDGFNDVLKILGSGFAEVDIKIFNRYGELVFETTNPDKDWDGKFNGIDQPTEVYTYYIKVVFADKSVVEDSGNITLLR